MGTIKQRKYMDPTEAEDINKRRQEYTEALYKKDLNDSVHFSRSVVPDSL